MADQTTPQKPQLTIRLICASDGKRWMDLVADEIIALGYHVLKPIGWKLGKPVYLTNKNEDRPIDFAVAILTPQYAREDSSGAGWTRDPSARDILYVWVETTPDRINGPWNKPGSWGTVISYSSEERAREEIRQGVKYLVLTCDRCGKLCRGGGTVQTVRTDTGELVETLCGDCKRQDRVQLYQDTKTIDTQLMVEASLDWHGRKVDTIVLPFNVCVDVMNDVYRIQGAIKRFETDVWFGAGVQSYYQNSKFRGHRLDPNENISVLMWGSAGRVMITFEHKKTGSWITAICAEDDPLSNMGIQGLNATADEAVELVDAATNAIKNGAKFKRDKKVTHPAVAVAKAQREAEKEAEQEDADAES